MAQGFERKPGTGVLYFQTNKRTPSQPDIRGEFKAGRDIKAGETFKIAGWIKPGQYGDILSIKEDSYIPKGKTNSDFPKEVTPDANDEDIPF